jgi:hypothetical protein
MDEGWLFGHLRGYRLFRSLYVSERPNVIATDPETRRPQGGCTVTVMSSICFRKYGQTTAPVILWNMIRTRNLLLLIPGRGKVTYSDARTTHHTGSFTRMDARKAYTMIAALERGNVVL